MPDHIASEPNGSELSPAQGALRFAIELAALACWGIAGWQVTDSAVRWILTLALPLVAATLWAALRVPDDRSANGRAPVPVVGIVRLLIELDVLLGAAVVIAIVWRPGPGHVLGVALGIAVTAHYAATHRRVRWLLDQRTA